MIEEARLESVESGLTPVTAGWFVVSAGDAAWMNNDATQACCIFESDDFVLRGRPDLSEYVKPGAGFALRVLRPGRPADMYHAESVQEDFLVVMGECILIIEDEERHLRAWDFVHCPPGAAHAFVGAGDGPCVIVCAGNRDLERRDVLARLQALGSCAAPRRERRAGHELGRGGKRGIPRPLARRAPGELERAPVELGLMTPGYDSRMLDRRGPAGRGILVRPVAKSTPRRAEVCRGPAAKRRGWCRSDRPST